jgi:polar amino acid transport system substrate-binding protein
MSVFKRRLILSMIAGCALLGTTVHAQTALETITKTKKIKIAIPTDYPPYGFVGVDLKPQGLDIDMANYLAEKLGATAELVPVTSTNRVPYLQTRKVDLVVSTLAKNPERAKVVAFTVPYSPFLSAVYAKKDLDIKSYADLAGKTVGVTRGTIEDQELLKLAPSSANIMRFEDHASTLSAFANGQTMTIASSQPAITSMIQKNPQINVDFKLELSQSPNYVGVNKDEVALREKVTEILRQARTDGVIEQLSMKWLKRSASNLPQE